MRLGPVLVDVAGLELNPDDIERLQHPQVGGVILFARNFAAPLQLIQLAHSIREVRSTVWSRRAFAWMEECCGTAKGTRSSSP